MWPQSQDYNEAIQTPDCSFGDSELKGGEAVTNALGMPMPRSGNFADVYEFVGASGQKWAIKCFTRQIPGLQERYGVISKHLLQARLPFMVDFTYLPKGIRIRGECFPVLKMEWVEGFLLNEFVRDNLDKPALLKALGMIWVRMATRLREAEIAHADLQHGNVILVPGRKESSLAVKLIDYDGMWVPALANKKSGEVGHPAYQHPLRLKQGTYSGEVDRLPLLAIACALRCLAVVGKPLWDRYDNGDNMLFREADLRNPAASALFKELWRINDAKAHALTGHLTIGLTGAIDWVPLLQDVVTANGVTPLSGAQEKQLAGLLGTGAIVNRPIPIAPIAKPATPLPGQATPSQSSSDWASLLDDGERTSTSGKGRSKKSMLAAVVALVILGFSAVGGVGGWMLLNKKQPDNDNPATKQVAQIAANGNSGLKEAGDNQLSADGLPVAAKGPGGDDRPKDADDEQKKDKPLAANKIAPKESKKPFPDKITEGIRPTTWKSLANMPTARSLLATVTGPDGRIYAIGGENASGRLDIVEVYDPSTNKWTKAAPMPTARNHLAAAMGPDNLIYAIGGVSSVPNIVEAYNPSTDKWTPVAPMPTARHGLAAVTGPDGRIYAIGGNGSGGSLNTVEAYDTSANTWATVANMPTARAYFAAATGPDGRIYAIGGFQEGAEMRLNTVEAYDTKTNTWTTVASMTTARNAHAAATGPDGRIYTFGGHTVGPMSNIVEAYDTKMNTWSAVPNMPTVRGQLAATTGRDGRTYAIGGSNGGFLNTVEALNFSTSKTLTQNSETVEVA